MLLALITGIAIGHYLLPVAPLPSPKPPPVSSATPAVTFPTPSITATPRIAAVAADSLVSSSELSASQVISQIKAALAHSGRQQVYAAITKVTDAISEKNVRDVLAFVQTLPQQDKSMLVPLLVGRWAELDPKAAVAYAESFPAGSFRNWALNSAISGWAERDSAAATTWAQQLPPGPARDQAMQTIISALADKDPQAALTFLQNLPANRKRQNLYWPIFSRWTMNDPLAAAERAAQLPAGTSRDTALQVVGSNWANQELGK